MRQIMKFLRVILCLSAILTLRAPAARGQEPAGNGTWGFVSVRYDTKSPTSIYSGYGWHGAFAMGGVTHNPRTGYAEVVGGVGAVVRAGTSEHWIALATAGTAAATFRQVYWLPTIRMHGLTTRAQVKWTIASGVQKLSISPVSVTIPLSRRVAGGVAADISAAEHAPPKVGTGLQLRIRLPGAVVGVDALRAVQGDASRFRLFFTSLF